MTLGRRPVLVGSAAAVAAALAGCTQKEAEKTTSAVHPDLAVLTGAISAKEHLVALYEATRRKHSKLARTVDPMLAQHREHLTALRGRYRPGAPSSSASPASPSATPKATTVPRTSSRAIAALRTAERKAAAARADEVRRATPALAQLLASIGACEAGHAAVLADGA